MKTPQDQRSNIEKQWQLDQLKQDKKFNEWIERKYNFTTRQLSQLFREGYIRIKNNETVSAKQMVEYYQKEQNVKDQVNELDLNSIDRNDLISKINDRTEVLKATSMINQKEHLKSLMGLEIISLGILLTIGVGKKLFKDVKDEVERQNDLNSSLMQEIPKKPKKRNKVKNKIWGNDWIKSQIYENTKNQNFSDAIWSDVDQLKARLDSVLVRSIANGTSNQKTATKFTDLVRKEIGNQTYVTERVARTESAKIEFQVQWTMAKNQGFDYVKWHAEPNACLACKDISEDDPTKHGQGVYKVDDVPDIPVHPNCRCSISTFWVDKD